MQSVHLRPKGWVQQLHPAPGGSIQREEVEQVSVQRPTPKDNSQVLRVCLHGQLSISLGLFPPWTSSDPKEVLVAYVKEVPVMVQVLGSLGTRTVTGLDACAFLAVCTSLGKGLLFHFQCQSAPSLQLENEPGPLPDCGRWCPLQRGHWAGRPLDGVVGGQP